jgi:hypothetical protein
MDYDAHGSADSPAELETELINLGGYSVSNVLNIPEYQLDPYLGRTLLQVERPCANLGGSGPPGRAD